MGGRRVVSVVGPGGATGERFAAVAHEVGRLLARRGAVVLTGGLDGVMAAAAAGAHAGGGVAIGLLPGSDRAGAAADLDVALPTGLGQARNALVVGAADGVIAVGGSWGTLSEIALARRRGVPVVCVAGWTVRDAAGDELDLDRAAEPEQAVALLAARLDW